MLTLPQPNLSAFLPGPLATSRYARACALLSGDSPPSPTPMCLQWFSLPSWALVFECVLLHGPDVAVDVDAAAQPAEVSMPPSSPAVEVTEGTPTPTHPSVGSTIAALLFKCFPQPFLFVTLSNNDVFVYRVRPWAGDSNSPDASRWANSCPLRLIREAIPIPQRLRHIDSELLHASGMMKPLRPLVAITSLGGSSCGGVAILGATPFLAVPNKGGIAVLPLTPPSSHTVGGMNLKAPLPSVCMPFPVTAFSEINLHSSILSCVYSFEVRVYVCLVFLPSPPCSSSLASRTPQGSLHMGHLPNIEEFTLYHTRGSSTSVVANVIELDCAARLAVFLSFTSTPSSQMYAVAVCADMDADLEAEAAREMQTLMEEGEEHDQMSMRWGPKEELGA